MQLNACLVTLFGTIAQAQADSTSGLKGGMKLRKDNFMGADSTGDLKGGMKLHKDDPLGGLQGWWCQCLDNNGNHRSYIGNPDTCPGKKGCQDKCGDAKYQYDSNGCPGECLGKDTLLFSCSADKYVKAGDVKPGDKLRTISLVGDVCSEVYYTFEHEGSSPALAFDVEGGSQVTVSPHHIIYVGESYKSRVLTLAKNVRVNDSLVSKTGPKKVVAIEATTASLVNVLTFNPALETEDGLLVSAHSFHETLYSYLFLPFKMGYSIMGPAFLETNFSEWAVSAFDNLVQKYPALMPTIISLAPISM